jgi:mycoredoxin
MEREIQVYGTDWCGLTRAVREYLIQSGFEYEYFDIDRDAAAQQFVLSMSNGRRCFPLVVVEHRIVIAPRLPELQRVLDERGIRPAPRRAARQPEQSVSLLGPRRR